MRKAAIILVVLIAAVVNLGYTQKPAIVTKTEPGWTKIGEITASFKMQDESIVVLGADEFDAIKLKVTDAPINIERVQVFYESGDMEELDVRSSLNAGSETRVMNLEQPNRDIKKVAFTYKTQPNYNGEKAHVELYGLKTHEHRDGDKSYRDDNNDGKNDLEEARDEVREDAREARDEVREETREARDEVREDAREARDEVKEESKEAREELREEANQAEENAEDAGQTFGQAVSEAAAKVEATITDDVYDGKYGPDGQKVFIDDDGTYYYVNYKGDKIKITKLEMRDNRPKKNDK
jgi:hypothetical protein